MQCQFGHNENRREFLRALSMSPLIGSAADLDEKHWTGSGTSYAFVGSLKALGSGSITAFRISGKSWTRIQEIPCAAPASLATHPNEQKLYAVNAIHVHNGLPQGTVDVFAVNARKGELSQVQTQPLSLSATEPGALVVAPDGRNLLIAAYGGGAYNQFPIEGNGTLGPVRCIVKELGCGLHPEFQAASHPHTLLLDRSRRFVIASDIGCDRLSVFSFNRQGEFVRHSQFATEPGSGPGSMVLHPKNDWLYVMEQVTPAISCYRYDPAKGIIVHRVQRIALSDKCEMGVMARENLAVDRQGRFMYTTLGTGIAIWAIDPNSGGLSFASRAPKADCFTREQTSGTLHAIDKTNGSVLRFDPGGITPVAAVSSPQCLTFLRC